MAERRPQPSWLALLPLSVLALLPLLAPEPLSLLRGLTSAALFTLVVTLAVRGRPLAVRTPLRREGRKLYVGDRAYEPLGLTLSGDGENWSTSAPVFQTKIDTSDGAVTLLEGADPAAVIAQAEALARLLALPLGPGWGLDERAFENGALKQVGSVANVSFRAPLRLSQKATGFTSLGSTIFVLGFTAMLLSARLDRGLPILTLSLVLPALTVLYGVIVSGWLLGLQATLELKPEGLVYEQAWFGRVLRRQRVSFDRLARAYAVGPAAQPTHVLLKSGSDWLAFRFVGKAAREFVTALMDSTTPTTQPDDQRHAPGNTRLSSASAAGS